MRTILVLLFALAIPPVFSQNLIVNGDFESHRDCPSGLGQYGLLNSWKSPNAATPDYFNDCSTQLEYGTEFNKKGGQIAHSGSAYAGFQSETLNRNEYYEYLTTELTAPLQADSIYCITMYVSLGHSTAALREIGAAFSRVELKNLPTSKIRIPFTALSSGSVLSDSLNWMCVSGYYQAHGGERFLTLGDFSPAGCFSEIPTGGANAGIFQAAYYFVDDVTVEKRKDRPCGCLP